MDNSEGREEGGFARHLDGSSILDSLPDPVVMVDWEMRLIYQNDTAINMIGRRIGEKCHKAVEDSEAPCEGCPVLLAFSDGRVHRKLRKVSLPDGSVRYMDMSASPVTDSGGDVVACVEAGRDVTDAKDAEARMRDSLSMLSHDIKNPVTTIQGLSEMLLQDGTTVGAEDLEAVALIKRSADKAGWLVDDFLALSKAEAGRLVVNRRPTALSAIIGGCIDESRPLATRKGVGINTELPDSLPHVYLDERLCRRVLSNMLGNAVKFSGPGGTVHVRAGIEQDIAEKVFMEVSDQGPGIPACDLPHVFEKYYRGSSNLYMPGTGIGLMVVKTLTELHGGTVDIKSAEGQGTTVRVTLPTSPPAV